MKRQRLTVRQRITRIRAEQRAPVDPDAPINFHVNWGVNEATGEPNPPSTDPQTLQALSEMVEAVVKAWREGKLPPPRREWPQE